MSNEQAPNEDEDLFEFDSEAIGASAGIPDALQAELEAAIEESGDSFDEIVDPLPPELSGYEFDQPEPSAGAPVTAPAKTRGGATTRETAAPVTGDAPARPTMLASPRTQLVLAAMVALNLLLVGLSWRSQDSTRELIQSLGVDRSPGATSPEVVDQPRAEKRGFTHIEPRAEGYETLEEAARAMERGEFQLAREMLFGLLAVIDRVEDSARYDVEARASFMVGDTFRLEADAMRLGAENASEEEQS